MFQLSTILSSILYPMILLGSINSQGGGLALVFKGGYHPHRKTFKTRRELHTYVPLQYVLTGNNSIFTFGLFFFNQNLLVIVFVNFCGNIVFFEFVIFVMLVVMLNKNQTKLK